MTRLWSYKDPRWERIDMNGFEVAARDGAAGRVGERGCEYLVLRTGPWIFRRSRSRRPGRACRPRRGDRLRPGDQGGDPLRTRTGGCHR